MSICHFKPQNIELEDKPHCLCFTCSFFTLFVRVTYSNKDRFRVKRSQHFALGKILILYPSLPISIVFLYYWLVRSEFGYTYSKSIGWTTVKRKCHYTIITAECFLFLLFHISKRKSINRSGNTFSLKYPHSNDHCYIQQNKLLLFYVVEMFLCRLFYAVWRIHMKGYRN